MSASAGRSRGVVLLNVMIMMIVMIMVAATMMNLSLGRYTAIRQHKASYDAKMATESVMLALQACLSGQTWPPSSAGLCSMSTPYMTLGSWSSCGTYCRQITGTVRPVANGTSYSITGTWYSPSSGSACGGSCNGGLCPDSQCPAQLTVTCQDCTD